VSVSITRKLEIDTGHRLMGHESKCRNVHGHRYVFMVTCTAPDLDAVGRVIDFSVIKSVLGGWLDKYWDHAFIYQNGDPIGVWLRTYDQRCYEFESPPTAENIAQFFLGRAQDLMAPYEIEVTKVVVWETPNCYAEAIYLG
jgi:6-pyruvoyltetrahydropterin/6-carboxytetrahydropterin synthase